MKKTQLELVKSKLLKDKFISRNWCLQRYISRLGAHTNRLKREEMNIIGEYRKTKNGRDYVYRLKDES